VRAPLGARQDEGPYCVQIKLDNGSLKLYLSPQVRELSVGCSRGVWVPAIPNIIANLVIGLVLVGVYEHLGDN
jgi:hypothetical protein